MVFAPTQAITAFKASYNALTDEDKSRVRELICAVLECQESTFYQYLHHPENLNKLERRYIALIFKADPRTFFNLQNP